MISKTPTPGLLGPLLLLACAEGGIQKPPPNPGPVCDPGETRCYNGFQRCDEIGQWETAHTCAVMCDPDMGCIECTPGTSVCQGPDVVPCDDSGHWAEPSETCEIEEGDQCWRGECLTACQVAVETRSYIGCEYWPTVTINPQLTVVEGLDFAVVVSNPHDLPVTVTVDGHFHETLAPHQVMSIPLPWEPRLQQEDQTPHSTFVSQAAFRLTSSLPVSAYQFNPLQYVAEGGRCEIEGLLLPWGCSQTNDASLLLPTGSLGREYMGVALPTHTVDGITMPGFLSIVGTEERTSVTIRSSAFTEEIDGGDAMAPGQTAQFTLDRGDVLQLVSRLSFVEEECNGDVKGRPCQGGADYDLTGTMIESDAPVAVFGGHACTFVPYDSWACDHVEEQIFPLLTWGQTAIAASTEPQVDDEPNLWKIISASDDNTVVFEPEVLPSMTLDAGEWVTLLHEGGFRVSGTGRVAVAQFMVGEDFGGIGAPPDVGDPSMALVVPPDQFRTSYDFLTPATFTRSVVTVVAPMGANVELDGSPVPDFTEIGETGFGLARVAVLPGPHHMASPAAPDVRPDTFGVMVEGLAPYTSYLYPGGLNLEPLEIEP